MASKKYAYYIKGNKIALAEQTLVSTGGGFTAVAHCTLSGYDTKDTCEAAGGQWIPGSSGMTRSTGEYRSPETNVDSGIEIEYAYAPTYNFETGSVESTHVRKSLGYGADDSGRLTLFFYGYGAYVDLSSVYAADDWIYIASGKWQGLHQVYSAGTSHGTVVLKTPFRLVPVGFVSSTVDVDFSTDDYLIGDDANYKKDIENFKDQLSTLPEYFLYIKASNTVNQGFRKVTYPDTDGRIDIGDKYTIGSDGNTDMKVRTTAANISTADDESINIWNAYYEPVLVYEGIEVMQDESFELDLPRNLSNAIVYYVRAKNAEDKGDYEGKEYFMREYKKMVEKHNSAKSRSIHIAQGNREIIR